MTTAQTIAATVTGANAVTLQCGYAQWLFTGRREVFEPGHVVREKRNRSGRCTLMECTYADGSRIRFTWSESAGGRFTAVKP